MQTHNYTYNFGFLAQWFKANPGISRRDVLTALGINDYKTLQNWTDGINIMPLIQILRLCNAFSVPLESFFCDMNAPAKVSPKAPDINTQTEPSCGWPEKNEKGGKHTYDPRTNVHTITNIPYAQEKQPSMIAPQTTDAIPDTTSMQERIQEERMRYLDIISKQMDQISELTKRQRLNDRPIHGYSPLLASEQIPK